MESAIIQSDFLDSLIKYIQHVRQVDNYIEFTIPPSLLIDNEEVLKYFHQDAVLQYERGKPGVPRGTIKDKNIFTYLINKFREL
jgi:hypothetical protein